METEKLLLIDCLKKKTSRVTHPTHPDSGLNISDSFSILERKKISANYLSDLRSGERDHDKVSKTII
jgi:hypothetical protein